MCNVVTIASFHQPIYSDNNSGRIHSRRSLSRQERERENAFPSFSTCALCSGGVASCFRSSRVNSALNARTGLTPYRLNRRTTCPETLFTHLSRYRLTACVASVRNKKGTLKEPEKEEKKKRLNYLKNILYGLRFRM